MDDLAALGVPPELREPLRAGRLEQRCPRDCREGWRRTYPGPEAAGFSCSACGAETGPADWFKPVDFRPVERRGAASHVRRGDHGSTTLETAPAVALTRQSGTLGR